MIFLTSMNKFIFTFDPIVHSAAFSISSVCVRWFFFFFFLEKAMALAWRGAFSFLLNSVWLVLASVKPNATTGAQPHRNHLTQWHGPATSIQRTGTHKSRCCAASPRMVALITIIIDHFEMDSLTVDVAVAMEKCRDFHIFPFIWLSQRCMHRMCVSVCVCMPLPICLSFRTSISETTKNFDLLFKFSVKRAKIERTAGLISV